MAFDPGDVAASVPSRYLVVDEDANGLGTGPLLDSPRAIWLDAANDRLVIADRNLQAVIVAHRESLDRVIVSR